MKRLDYNQIAPNGAKAPGGVHAYVMQSGPPSKLVDLVYLRGSQIKNCAYCLDVCTRDLTKKEAKVEKFALVQPGRRVAVLSTQSNALRLPGPSA
ncbi:carboxymuconolactone decarboxylase family protein [Bradyrhizobium liaoningense]|nr:carboxymuconolactone decarboxylase family protein [Bradyrhizobium liaoningense]